MSAPAPRPKPEPAQLPAWHGSPAWAASPPRRALRSPPLSPTPRGPPCPPPPQQILAPKGGFMGMVGERGIGGSKCGSTAAVALIYKHQVGVSKGLVGACAAVGAQMSDEPTAVGGDGSCRLSRALRPAAAPRGKAAPPAHCRPRPRPRLRLRLHPHPPPSRLPASCRARASCWWPTRGMPACCWCAAARPSS